jgi:hypothetical protein
MRTCTLFLLALAFTGCARTVTERQLSDRIIATNGLSFVSRLYYVGSKDQFDYFIEKGMGSQSYRIARGSIVIPTRMPRTDDESQWRVCVVEGRWSADPLGIIQVPEPAGGTNGSHPIPSGTNPASPASGSRR